MKKSINFSELTPLPFNEAPNGYEWPDGLRRAVEVAILLDKPLLVTGASGVGKTSLASAIKEELKCPLFKFVAKTNSIGRDLLYVYDSLWHFHDANKQKEMRLGTEKTGEDKKHSNMIEAEKVVDEYSKYIRLQALGEAIKLADEIHNPTPSRSVVLIDEIDKAPRDFPNDLLREIEDYEFEVYETGEKYNAHKEFRPIIVVTSNGERQLPEAFLRRCVYFHISFPSRERLVAIVKNRLGEVFSNGSENSLLELVIAEFDKIREICKKKQPSTSELLSWIQILDHKKFNPAVQQRQKSSEEESSMEIDVHKLSDAEKDILELSFSVLAKDDQDLEALKKAYLISSNNH